MSRRIFVSYKYADSAVAPLASASIFPEPTTARHYVNTLQHALNASDHFFQGENDGEDLSDFKEETIETKLKNKIFGTSTTIVLISKNMIDQFENEEDQWIPWEISYSLKEITRNGVTSRPNAMLAVVLPDENSSYEYFASSSPAGACDTITWKTQTLFEILGNNMFNRKSPNYQSCAGGCCERQHYGDDHSFIRPVKWTHFISDVDYYINLAHEMRDRIDEFNVQRVVKRA